MNFNDAIINIRKGDKKDAERLKKITEEIDKAHLKAMASSTLLASPEKTLATDTTDITTDIEDIDF